MKFIVADEKWMEKWDNVVSNQFSGHFMQSLAWGKFRKTSGWEPRYLLAIQKNQIKMFEKKRGIIEHIYETFIHVKIRLYLGYKSTKFITYFFNITPCAKDSL